MRGMEQKRYSEMSEWELKQEIAALTEKARKAEQMGMVNEYAVYERKMAVAKSYLLNPDNFQPGEFYEIKGDPQSLFKLQYVNGVFAWGYRLSDPNTEVALPISLLKKRG
ncbi:DUF1811 domain-containing protein [Neobacillus thermocopriae]|nr:DUF1811 domain-containing protein [Neobacillus thermocopriae]